MLWYILRHHLDQDMLHKLNGIGLDVLCCTILEIESGHGPANDAIVGALNYKSPGMLYFK
jgi:hypothetical protein